MTAYNRRVRAACLLHAILAPLRAPSAVWAEVIRAHFLHKRAVLLNQLQQWQADLPVELRSLAEEIKSLLEAL